MGIYILDRLGEIFNRFFESFDDRLALIGNTPTLQSFTFGFTFCCFDHTDLVCLGLLYGCYAQALSSINFIHTFFYFGIWINISHQRFHNAIPKVVHNLVELSFYSHGDVVFHLEEFIKVCVWHAGTDGIKYKSRNLTLWILQAIKCINGFGRQDIVLHTYDDKHKNVIFGFSFDAHIKLLNSQ